MIDLSLVSATQISLFLDCQRKWAFRYLDHIETPKHRGAELGTEVQDEQLDPWLREGRVPDFGRASGSGEIAQALIPLLPAPIPTGQSPGLELRRKFVMPSPTGRFAYQGELDAYAPDSAIVPGLVVEGYGGVPLVGDVKTTGNLAYAKNASDLLHDVQATIYEMVVAFENGADQMDLVWWYTRTRGARRAQRTVLRVGAAHIASEFSRIDAIGDELVTIKQEQLAAPLTSPAPAGAPGALYANRLPPNPRMCEAYGGCPFRHVCNLSPAVHAAGVNLEALSMPSTNDFLANLRKQTTPAPIAGVTAPPAAPPPTPVHVPPVALPAHPAPPPSAFQAMAVAEAARQGVPHGDFVPTGQAPSPVPMHPVTGSITHPGPVVPAQHAPPAINPPESRLPPASPTGAAAPAPPAAPARGRGRPPALASAPAPAAEGPGIEVLEKLASLMRAHGVKRIAFAGDKIAEVEVVEVV